MQAIPILTGEPTSKPTSDQVSFNTSFFEYYNGESISPEYEPVQISQDLLQDRTSSLPSLPSDAGTRLRGPMRKMSCAMAESVSQKDFYGKGRTHYMAAQAITSHDYDQAHNEHLALQNWIRHPIAFLAEMMGDFMHLHQALWQPDACQFVNSVVKEINGCVDQKHWLVILKEEVPEDTDIIPSVWALWCKRNLTTGAITKHKARLNLHGGKQEFGMTYYDMYAPVVTWFATRLMIVFGILFNWSLWQVDFVMAYPQATIEIDMYMEITQGIHLKNGNSKDHLLKLLANLYSQKQAGCVWNSYLVNKLLEIEFKQSMIDDCVFYRGDVIFIVYVDSSILIGSSDERLTNIITELQNLDLDIEDQGHPAN